MCVRILISVFACLFSPYACCQAVPGPAADGAAIHHLLGQYAKAVDTLDLRLLTQIWSHSPAVSFIYPSLTLVGTEPAPEMERLTKALSGSWCLTITLEPSEAMPKGGIGHGEEVWRSGPGGLSLIEDYHSTGDEGEITGMGVFWWDRDVRRFQVTWCDNTTSTGCSEMTKGASWDRDDLVLRNDWKHEGQQSVFKEVFSQIKENTFTQRLYQGESENRLKLLASIYARKKCH